MRKHGESKRAVKNGENGKDITKQVQNKEKGLQVIIEADKQQKQLNNLQTQVGMGETTYLKLLQEVFQ